MKTALAGVPEWGYLSSMLKGRKLSVLLRWAETERVGKGYRGEAEGRDSSMTLRKTRSAVHHGGGVEPLFSQVGARRLVFQDPGFNLPSLM